MKKPLFQKIEIPKGVEVHIIENLITTRGPEGENEREFNFGKVKVEKKGDELILSHNEATRKEKKMMNTLATHIKNMIKGVQEKFVYVLKVASSHFPITVKVEGNVAVIKNFLGEKKQNCKNCQRS